MDLNQGIKRRTQIKASLTRFMTFLEQNQNADQLMLKSRYERFGELWGQFKNIQAQIEMLDDSDRQISENEIFEDRYFLVDHEFRTMLAKFESPALSFQSCETSSANSSASSKIKIKLPELSLPKFYGEYKNWTSFVESFSSLIDNNPALDNIQRFQYLRSSLVGEPLNLIKTLSTTNENYNVAWDLLKTRYQNTRLIVKQHIHTLCNLPNVNKNSASSIRNLLNTVTLNLKSLNNLGQRTESWDLLIVEHMMSKFDTSTVSKWEVYKIAGELPTLNECVEFLTRKCTMLESVGQSKVSESDHSLNKRENKFSFKPSTHVSVDSRGESCALCEGTHSIHQCEEFLKLPVVKRIERVKSLKLCINCLRSNHFVSRCLSKFSCKTCKNKHHSSLHLSNQNKNKNEDSETQASIPSVEEVASSSNNIAKTNQGHTQVLLSTAIVQIKDAEGNYKDVRCLLDQGSQSNFITQKACQNLKLSPHTSEIKIGGIGNQVSAIKGEIDVQILSKYDNFNANITCLVLPDITDNLPHVSFNKTNFVLPKEFKLADTSFNVRGPIDMLLGAELFWDVLKSRQHTLGQNKPILHETRLGWILGGKLHRETKNSVNLLASQLDKQVERFWKIEDIFTNEPQIIRRDTKCEKHFLDTHQRDASGRYIVCLPFKSDPALIGDTRNQAVKRFLTLEQKLQRNIKLKQSYTEFINEYLNLDHMEKCDTTTIDQGAHFYLPHHAVHKLSNLELKIRVVFDGSAKGTNGISLNDTLMVGPTIQHDLFSILCRFRTHRYAFTTDITKMYRQFRVSDEDSRFQLIVWRNNPNEELSTYRLKTITYGTACAPFLATRCLLQLAEDECKQNLLVKQTIKNDFYIDDLLTGSNTLSDARQLRDNLTHTLSRAGLSLCKWASNSAEFMSDINSNLNSSNNISVDLNKTVETKVLGLSWNCTEDKFFYDIKHISNKSVVTKRTILSGIAQLFDPLGLLGPVIISARVLLQTLWKKRVTWDQPISDTLRKTWLTFLEQLSNLNNLKIDRLITSDHKAIYYEAHGFCDASLAAYGACIYIRSITRSGNVTVKLLCARSRVAPLRALTIPRLELSGALLLAKLYSKVSQTFVLPIKHWHFWTDSSIVLAWLSSESTDFEVFVSNRISKIQTLTSTHDWSYVKSSENPADILSRGLSAPELISSELWWHGPQFLNTHPITPAKYDFGNNIENISLPDRKTTALSSRVIPQFDLNKYSSFSKLKRVTAYCMRFIYNCRNSDRKPNELSVSELQEATYRIIKIIQLCNFGREIHDLKTTGSVHRLSKILSLNPFLDSNDLLRVGGRLKQSNLPYDAKHPFLLPPKNNITDLIIREEHERLLHAGQQATLASIRHRYWLIAGKASVRKVIFKCIRCFRNKPRGSNPIMGNLPLARVEPSRPFLNCGIDYAGPIVLRKSRGRPQTTTKSYIALFICFATKALHIELVSDLTSNAFLAAFRRFIARRGLVRNVFTDNGTNFVGAERELREISDMIKASKTNIIENTSNLNITWHFIPPRSPHFGGLWEANIKSVKSHMRKIVGEAHLTFEEMTTLLVQIEAILNSRPLEPSSNDPNDLSALTPSHFLIGDLLTAPLEPNLQPINVNRLDRWQRIQQLRQHFWARWSREYLTSLQQRSKWKTNSGQPIEPGMLVLIRDKNLPPLRWHLGRVIKVHPGEDKVVRVVSLKTQGGIINRSVVNICPLPIDIN